MPMRHTFMTNENGQGIYKKNKIRVLL
ncbi:uncharacterized protein METZ01_LOCUS515759 [marine metagenome]|uniref:Uncharacterized protein n=1 Tax=marine metagenome TaxID=408172 RepID=A0A383F3A5_9ZZZZ